MIERYIMVFFAFCSVAFSAITPRTWHALYGDTLGVIKEVEDPEKNYKVMEFQSQSSRDTYINGASTGVEAWKEKRTIINWEMKFSESYVIMIAVETLEGLRNLIYTAGEEGGTLYFGLGAMTIDGTWHRIRRDLEADLQRYEPNNSIVAVNAFLVRGSGRIGAIQLLGASNSTPLVVSTVNVKKKRALPPPVQVSAEEVKTSVVKPSESHKNSLPTVRSNTPPVIKLNEAELIYHQLGEPFFDPSATAKDSQGRSLKVDTLGEVDINNIGRYVLTYIATDSAGNTATQARVVMVYKEGMGATQPKKAPLRRLLRRRIKKPPVDDGVGGAEDDMPLPVEQIEALD